jgi:hypothetical protein
VVSYLPRFNIGCFATRRSCDHPVSLLFAKPLPNSGFFELVLLRSKELPVSNRYFRSGSVLPSSFG